MLILSTGDAPCVSVWLFYQLHRFLIETNLIYKN